MSEVRCTDGSRSFAGGKQGACSHHGGMARNIPVAPDCGCDTPAVVSKGGWVGTVVTTVVLEVAFLAFQAWKADRRA